MSALANDKHLMLSMIKPNMIKKDRKNSKNQVERPTKAKLD